MSADTTAIESWVDADDDKAGDVLVRYAHALEARMESRLRNWEIFAAVYSEQLETSLRPSRQRYLSQPSATRNANLTFNVGRSLVDTEHATVTEALPRPTFLTEAGNRPLQDKAIELQLAIDGIFSDLRVYDTVERSERDKGVLGTGVTKIHAVNGRPAVDRVLISEILVDEDLLGAGQDPRAIIHRQEIPRDAMLAYMRGMGADVRKAIEDAPELVTSGLAGRRADLISVYDAHSLPLDEENPGRHIIGIEDYDGVLFTEEWKSPRLPYVFQFWQRPTTGFYGIGIIEQILGIQVEINRFYRNVSRALKMWGVPTAFVPSIAKINLQTMTNSPEGKFIPYDPGGGTPVMWNQNILSPEVMQWLNFQIENAYKVTGIPQNTAFSQREAGIPSAQGQREISQKAASRLAPQSKQYERAFVDIAWRLDDIVRELKKDGEQLVISTPDQGGLHKVDIDAALSLEPGSYHIDIFAGNFLSRHPASKREELQELAKGGTFTPQEVRKLVQMPDIDAALGKEIDYRGIYQKQIQAALSKGTYTRPESYWPEKEMGVKLYADALFENQNSSVPDKNLEVLRNWLNTMRDIMQPPPTATPGVPAGAPAPLPPPQAAPQTQTQGAPQ